MKPDDKILEEWKRHRDTVLALCHLAKIEGDFVGVAARAAELGTLKKEFHLSLSRFEDSRVSIMRAFARCIIPDEFDWQIAEVLGGDPLLVFTGYTTHYSTHDGYVGGFYQ